FITNFSCGPDSFIIGYFRDIMGRKPSLTLELDNHTADAGLETRIEAFLDIVSAYRKLFAEKRVSKTKRTFIPARTTLDKGIPKVITSSGEVLPMTDSRVKLLVPSMGRLVTESLAAVFRGSGINAIAHPPSDEAVLKLGRANTSCKECLPLILTTGTLLNFIFNEKKDSEILVYFMATGSGPCRFGQYRIFMEDLIRKKEIPNVALFSLTSENSYAGMGNDFHLKAWWGVIVSDVMEDIRSMILANAVDTEAGVKVFEDVWNSIVGELEIGDFSRLETQLEKTARRIRQIPMKRPPEAVPAISLVGEIFVRRDALSRQYLTEWLYLVDKGLVDHTMSKMEKLTFILKKNYMARYQKRIQSKLAGTGLVNGKPLNIQSIINNASPHISPNLAGEAILTVGSSLTEIVSHTCMPNRLAEAILNEAMTRDGKLATDPSNHRLRSTLAHVDDLPFLAIEGDGSPFPQIINANLEAFCLRAERLHNSMLEVKNRLKAKRN
ncbi:MAG: activase, partial [Deltaproteobacteria bacterium]|nr:activase [Deltaproteobacteria bacterium]